MPLYQYSCPEHGTVDVIKPMAEAGRAEVCALCPPKLTRRGKRAKKQPPMRRIYNPQGFIMRSSGYNLHPEDPRYSNFDREAELGEIRSPGDKPESGGATVTRPRPRVDHSSASIAAERNLRQAVEAAIVEV